MNFDATVDFENGALEIELARHVDDGTFYVVIVRADSDTGEGEIYSGDDTYETTRGEDWIVTGRSVSELATALRVCL